MITKQILKSRIQYTLHETFYFAKILILNNNEDFFNKFIYAFKFICFLTGHRNY